MSSGKQIGQKTKYNTWYVALLHLFSFSLQAKYFMVILE